MGVRILPDYSLSPISGSLAVGIDMKSMSTQENGFAVSIISITLSHIKVRYRMSHLTVAPVDSLLITN